MKTDVASLDFGIITKHASEPFSAVPCNSLNIMSIIGQPIFAQRANANCNALILLLNRTRAIRSSENGS